ncbi:MAG: hopanoid biosynthesis-associated protein HpnK [Deltaproteobacteria bacterium]|nr:hopanoid biosynthesis-associated protein HpnK [Deltaproteobacteria bacterium]
MAKKLIVTADDFGLCAEVNAAVVQAHAKGILTSASLMVGESAADEAFSLAKKNPTLKVGLHLTLVEGTSVLPRSKIPDLVDENQKFSSKIVAAGVKYFFSEKLQKQISMECEAQIQKFLEGGLVMDHLDSHNHIHIHPTILATAVRLCKKYKIKAIRVPWQGWRSLNAGQALNAVMMAPWVATMRAKLRAARIAFNDEVFGLFESGRMTEEAWLKIIPKIKDGVTEIYCHPAIGTAGILKETMPNYQHEAELKALLSPKVKKLLEEAGIERTTFTEMSLRA